MKIRLYAPFTATFLLMASFDGTFAADEMVRGEVKKIDAAAGKITLTSGPIKSLDMDEDNMTMVFRVQDPAMLKQVKVGDKVQFVADSVNGQIMVTKLQKAK
jgi:Cu(I)/Ag(I) efflux system periplasmic protein CusF